MARVLTTLVLVYGARAGLLTGLADLLPPVITDGFENLVRAAADTCEMLPLESLFSREYPLEMPHLELIVFTRYSQSHYRVLELDRLLQEHELDGRLLLYIPGWWNTPTDGSTSAVVRALLAKNEPVLVLDTRLSFCRGYVAAASRVGALARLLYDLIGKLNSEGVAPERVHLVGFSLGAHVAGITGKLLTENTGRRLERITALDPAKPCFAKTTAFRLDRRDAEFVQVLHTSAGVLGLQRPVGHVDVYMNGVTGNQPECRDRRITLECDHAQSWKLYSASVTDESSLMGRGCRSWEELTTGSCRGRETVLGYGCNSTERGLFLYKSNEIVKRDLKYRQTKRQRFRPIDLLESLFG